MYIDRILYNGGISRSSYLNSLGAVRYFIKNGLLELDCPVSFFVGENGTGKSTLIEAVAVRYGFNPEGGTKNFSFSTEDTHSSLYRHLTLSRTAFANDGFFLRAEGMYNAYSYINRLDGIQSNAPKIISSYGGVSLHEQSHGESFLSVVQNRFGGNGLYILDEPEAALSPLRQMTLLCEIDRLVKSNSQFIIATHSPVLMAYPDAAIYQLDNEGIKRISYDECEHVNIYRRFLEAPERTIKHLFSEDNE